MAIDGWISYIRTYYKKLSERQQSVVVIVVPLCFMFLFYCLLKAFVAILFYSSKGLPEPILVRKADQIIVPEHSPLRSQLLIQPVKISSSPHIVSIPGVVESSPYKVVNILPPVLGRLVGLKVNLGDHVEKNQILAIIRSPDFALANADHDKALSAVKLTLEALNRAKKVNLAGANSIKDIELAQNNHAQALAELKRTESVLKALGARRENSMTIIAPTKGRVIALNYGLGSYITDPTQPILTIANNYSIWVTANVPENIIAQVKKGLAADIQLAAYPSKKWHGQVSFVNAFLDADSRRNKTRIVIDNPDLKLQANMYAIVRLALNELKQIIVPLSAILMNDDTTSVYVEKAPWVFMRQPVSLGSEDGDNVRVISGLKPGDRIVMRGGIFVND